MAFQPAKGDWVKIRVPSKASTTYTEGAILQNDGTDNIHATTASTAHIGICASTKSSSDTSTDPIYVWVPRGPNCTMYGDVGSGTPAVANVGKTCDLATASTVAWGTNAHKQLMIRGYISATRGEFSLNSLQQTLPAA